MKIGIPTATKAFRTKTDADVWLVAAYLQPQAEQDSLTVFNCLAGFARAFQNVAQQFFLFAFGVLEVVIRKLRLFLFELALGDVSGAFTLRKWVGLLSKSEKC